MLDIVINLPSFNGNTPIAPLYLYVNPDDGTYGLSYDDPVPENWDDENNPDNLLNEWLGWATFPNTYACDGTYNIGDHKVPIFEM